jgi:hypothetical protein
VQQPNPQAIKYIDNSEEIMHSFARVASALLPSAMALAATTVFAQDANRLGQLERRMDGIEAKLDALIQLQTKGAPEAVKLTAGLTQDSSGSASRADGQPQPGVNMDIYSLPLMQENDKLPVSPSGFPTASKVIERAQPFNLALFERTDGVSQFANPSGKSIGQLFSGKVVFPDSGAYVFQATMSKPKQGYTPVINCVTSVIVDETVVASTYTRAYDYNPVSSSENGAARLEGGMHNLAIWAICDRVSYSGMLQIELSLKAPGDRSPKPFDASRFLVDG